MADKRRQGEEVYFSLEVIFSVLPYIPIEFFDANAVPRTLQSYERFILDSFVVDGDAQAEIFLMGNLNAASSTNFPVIAFFGSERPFLTPIEIPGEGISFPPGFTPVIRAIPQNSGGFITGTGRIVAQTYPGRQIWREGLVAGETNGRMF
jgi:hypothetical protein